MDIRFALIYLFIWLSGCGPFVYMLVVHKTEKKITSHTISKDNCLIPSATPANRWCGIKGLWSFCFDTRVYNIICWSKSRILRWNSLKIERKVFIFLKQTLYFVFIILRWRFIVSDCLETNLTIANLKSILLSHVLVLAFFS